MHVFSEIDDSIVLLIINAYESFIKGFPTLGSDDGYYVNEYGRFQHAWNGD